MTILVEVQFIDSYEILLQQLRFDCRELNLKVSVIKQGIGSCLETGYDFVSVGTKSAAINKGKLNSIFHSSLR